MVKASDLSLYLRDWIKYNHVYKCLFWYKKNKGYKWIKGQNFGDYLSLIIVGKLLDRFWLNKIDKSKMNERRLLAIGSILHFAKNNDVIWGSGVNGKINPSRHSFKQLDVRMVRGLKTKVFLQNKGIDVANVFGDPGLLMPTLFPEFKYQPEKGKVILLPNLNELELCRKRVPLGMKLVSPMAYWTRVVFEILSSELVLTSSLHGLVVAESFGVPVRLFKPVGGETLFKYQDYYLGTGRDLPEQLTSFRDKITTKSGLKMPPPVFDVKSILDAFPKDIFI